MAPPGKAGAPAGQRDQIPMVFEDDFEKEIEPGVTEGHVTLFFQDQSKLPPGASRTSPVDGHGNVRAPDSKKGENSMTVSYLEEDNIKGLSTPGEIRQAIENAHRLEGNKKLFSVDRNPYVLAAVNTYKNGRELPDRKGKIHKIADYKATLYTDLEANRNFHLTHKETRKDDANLPYRDASYRTDIKERAQTITKNERSNQDFWMMIMMALASGSGLLGLLLVLGGESGIETLKNMLAELGIADFLASKTREDTLQGLKRDLIEEQELAAQDNDNSHSAQIADIERRIKNIEQSEGPIRSVMNVVAQMIDEKQKKNDGLAQLARGIV